MVHLVGDQVFYFTFFIFPFCLLILDFDGPVSFVDDSFPTWLAFAKDSVANALVIFSRNYQGFSVAHDDFATVVSLVKTDYLPCIELETAYSGFLTYTEPATAATP